ncbi:uncharacterized protein [Typha angustifolia]|uniref:uncharacterized protein isoform X1 n=1 Tax=Typha angustifolia TaxID=59011 RepID=UPI003C2F007F
MTTTRSMAARRDDEEEILPIEEEETIAGTSTRRTIRSNRNTEEPSVLSMLGSISEQIAINNQMMMEMMRELRASREAMSNGKAPSTPRRESTPLNQSSPVQPLQPQEPLLPPPYGQRQARMVTPGPVAGEPIRRANHHGDHIGDQDPWAGRYDPEPRRVDLNRRRDHQPFMVHPPPVRQGVGHDPERDNGIRGQVVRLEFPKFKGGDPIDWLYRAEQFFAYQGTAEEYKVTLASFHLEDAALHWFRSANAIEAIETWAEFCADITRRFGVSGYEDFDALLSKTVQKTTVGSYQEEFERISSRCHPPWTDQQLRSTFISGLRGDIQADVRALRPRTLKEAFQDAVLMEDKHRAMKIHWKQSWTSQGSRNQALPNIAAGNTSGVPRAATALIPPRAPLKPSQDVKYAPRGPGRALTPAQVEERRAKGLCFRCDEKFVPGHRCAKPMGSVMLIDGLEDELAAESADVAGHRGEEVEEQNVEDVIAEISLHAYSGTAAPKTLRVNGVVKKTTVRILIDTGSTHNFIDKRLLRKIGLESEPTEGFDVTIGDGTTLRADFNCGGPVLMGWHRCKSDGGRVMDDGKVRDSDG